MDLVTVYRSMDATAKEDCDAIVDLLSAAGFSPVVLDDKAPGVPEGTYEVRVPAEARSSMSTRVAGGVAAHWGKKAAAFSMASLANSAVALW